MNFLKDANPNSLGDFYRQRVGERFLTIEIKFPMYSPFRSLARRNYSLLFIDGSAQSMARAVIIFFARKCKDFIAHVYRKERESSSCVICSNA